MICFFSRAAPFCFGPLIMFLLMCAISQSQDERAVRAAYVFNLIKFVEWRPDAQQLVVGIVGSRSTSEFIQALLHDRVSGALTIHTLLSPSAVELSHCDLIYSAESSGRKLMASLENLHLRGVLTVGEANTFIADGGMIGLIRVGDQIQMQLNLEALERGGIKFNPHLLDVAVIVSPGTVVAQNPSPRKLLERENAVYPGLASRMSLHGTVKLEVRIARNGTVSGVEYVGGHPLLANAAIKSVHNWKYEPAATESTQTVQFRF